MEENSLQKYLKELFPSNEPDEVEYQSLITQTTQVVTEMLDHEPEMLFSYLYRLDVEEGKIKKAFDKNSIIPIPVALAYLIVDRQIQRIKTQKQFSK